jgi:acetolactate synthase-1/2/3 large subunit
LPEYTGGEIVAEYLLREKVPYIAGVGGHGIMPFLDAFKDRSDSIKVIQVRHEQSAVHLADAYYRVSGKPLVCFTTLGPGSLNAVMGLATAYVDSSAVIAISGDTHTYMMGTGTLQEIERNQWADTYNIFRYVTKRFWRVQSAAQLPAVIHQAFKVALTGRPGPTSITLPMDVQAESAEVEIPEPTKRRATGLVYGDPRFIAKATQLLAKAERPVILAGGGVAISNGSRELVTLAELLGAAVITTGFSAKGVIPEDHPLCAFYAGSKGTTCGNKLARDADVLLAVGCRFADETTSSYKPGVSFSIPPTKLIHVDIDPAEIGKNYPVEVGIVGDARAVLGQLIDALRATLKVRKYQDSRYFKTIQRAKKEWEEMLEPLRKSSKQPMTLSRFLYELRKVLPRDAIVVGAAGHAQAQLFQEFPVYYPRTHISDGGNSAMGWAVPAALGAKLARPDKVVAAVCGDGDFLMTCQELATAAQYEITPIYFVINNCGWLSIRDLQIDVYGEERGFASEFRVGNTGELYSPDFVKMAESFRCRGELVEKPSEIGPALTRCLSDGVPALIEVPVQREHPWSEGVFAGWWDVPVPAYLGKK